MNPEPLLALEAELIGVTVTGRPRYRWICILPNGVRAVLCVDETLASADELVRTATSALAAYNAMEERPPVRIVSVKGGGPYR